MTARHDKATVDQAIADVRRKWGGVTAREVVLADAVEEQRIESERFHRHVETMIEPQLLARAKAAEAERDRLAARVAELEAALRDGARIASQHLDPKRGDLDDWVDRAILLATNKEPA